MDGDTPKANGGKSNNVIIGIGIIVVLAIVAVVGFYSMGKPATTTSTVVTSVATTLPTTSVTSVSTTTIPAGPLQPYEIILGYHATSFTVGPGARKTINFTVPVDGVKGSINGTYVSTGSIEAATLTPAQYNQTLSTPGAIATMPDYYGSGTNVTMATPLTPGNYTLVFYNPSTSASDNVTVAQTILLSYYRPS